MSARSLGFLKLKFMSLLDTKRSVSDSHFSSASPSQVKFDAFIASEYLKVETLAAFHPNTPRSRGPSFSLSSEWQDPQRFWNNSSPRIGSPLPRLDRARVTAEFCTQLASPIAIKHTGSDKKDLETPNIELGFRVPRIWLESAASFMGEESRRKRAEMTTTRDCFREKLQNPFTGLL